MSALCNSQGCESKIIFVLGLDCNDFEPQLSAKELGHAYENPWKTVSYLFRKYSLTFLVFKPSYPSMASEADILSDESEVLYYLGYIWLQATGYPPSNIFRNKDVIFSRNRKSGGK